MKNNCSVPENESALQVKALRCLSENKLDGMENKLEHIHKALCIYNTLELLAKVKRGNRKRRCTQQNDIPPKRQRMDSADKEDKDAYQQELD